MKADIILIILCTFLCLFWQFNKSLWSYEIINYASVYNLLTYFCYYKKKLGSKHYTFKKMMLLQTFKIFKSAWHFKTFELKPKIYKHNTFLCTYPYFSHYYIYHFTKVEKTH